MDTIYKATLRRCVEEQELAYTAHVASTIYLQNQLYGRAAQCQRDARYHHGQAMMRLERLIGVA